MSKSSIVLAILVFAYSMQASASFDFERAGFDVADYWAYQTKFMDKDGDGALDVLSSSGSHISIYERQGTGYVYYSREGIVGQDFLAHDFDEDGYEDIVAYPYRIYRNDGAGHFETISSSRNGELDTIPTSEFVRLQKADLDHNGELDLVVTHWNKKEQYGNGSTFAIFNVRYDPTLDGNFAYERLEKYSIQTNLSQLQGQTARGVAIGDLNGDGFDDLIYINAYTELSESSETSSVVAFNDGEGNFATHQLISEANGISLGDLDGDGDLDAFLARSDNPFIPGSQEAFNEIWLNDGSGTFIRSSNYLGNDDSLDVRLADFDGDGDLDAFVANRNAFSQAKGQAHTLWENDGTGFFDKNLFEFGGDYVVKGMDVVDIDQDGDFDIVVLGGSESFSPDYGSARIATNQVWLNKLIPNDVSASSFEAGVEFCKQNPAECDLYVLADVEAAYDLGFTDGQQSCALNPSSCDLFGLSDLNDAKQSGYATGLEDGKQTCIDNPESCGLYGQQGIEEAYQIGVTDGNKQCTDNPASCGLFNQDYVDRVVDREKNSVLDSVVADLPGGIVISTCRKNANSPLCAYVGQIYERYRKYYFQWLRRWHYY